MFTIRLWHHKLLPVLPDKMLVAEWRECIAIKRQWEKGTLKHRLVSYVMDYKKCYFLTYVNDVVCEMMNRNIKFDRNLYNELEKFCEHCITDKDYKEHNNRYLVQCYYNLQEKYDRRIITQEEWEKIKDCPDLYDVDVYDGDF